MDTSEEALRQAQANSKSLDLSVQWFQDDVFDTQFLRHHPELAYQFDVVVSNPPYILNEERSNLDAEVVNYEPELALFCRSTGHMYESLMSTSKQLLKKPGGRFYFELHERYGEEVRTLYSSIGIEAKIVKDLGEKDRFIVGTL
jgi:release factor glutamine methyltransferase